MAVYKAPTLQLSSFFPSTHTNKSFQPNHTHFKIQSPVDLIHSFRDNSRLQPIACKVYALPTLILQSHNHAFQHRRPPCCLRQLDCRIRRCPSCRHLRSRTSSTWYVFRPLVSLCWHNLADHYAFTRCQPTRHDRCEWQRRPLRCYQDRHERLLADGLINSVGGKMPQELGYWEAINVNMGETT